MGHYAIALNYNFDQKGSNKGITEYFLPFSIDVLLQFELPSFVKKALQNCEHNTQYPLDKMLRVNNNLMATEFIVYLEDDEIKTIEANQLGIDDYESASFISAWDLIAEANLVFKSYQSQIQQYERDVSLLSKLTEESKNDLLTMKIFASVLVQLIYHGIHTDTSYIREVDIPFFDMLIERVNSGSNLADLESRWKELEDRSQSWNDLYRAYNIAAEIITLSNDIRDSEDITRRNSYENEVKVLLKEMVEALREPFEDGYYRYCTISAVLRNKRIYEKKNFNSFKDFLKIDERDLSRKTFESINQCVSELQFELSYISSGIFLPGEEKVYSLKQYFGSDVATNYARQKYLMGYGCFALLITNSDKHYFSLSGIMEELNPKAGKLAEPVKYIMEHILNLKPVSDIMKHDYAYNYAYITKELAVRRYTEIVKDPDFVSLLPRGFMTFDKDWAKDPEINYNLTYSCCERKMLAYSGYNNALYIFSRWLPCKKCRPAIADAHPVKVFAFDDLDDYKKNGCASNKLKEFKMNPDFSYTVSCI